MLVKARQATADEYGSEVKTAPSPGVNDNAIVYDAILDEIADLGLPTSLHDSHASYVSHWMTVMRADTSAIFTAAARAEQAFAYLRGFSTPAAGEQKAPAAGEPEIPAAIAA